MDSVFELHGFPSPKSPPPKPPPHWRRQALVYPGSQQPWTSQNITVIFCCSEDYVYTCIKAININIKAESQVAAR